MKNDEDYQWKATSFMLSHDTVETCDLLSTLLQSRDQLKKLKAEISKVNQWREEKAAKLRRANDVKAELEAMCLQLRASLDQSKRERDSWRNAYDIVAEERDQLRASLAKENQHAKKAV